MEEMSIVYIKVPIDLICLFTDVRFNIDFVESMVELAEYSGLDEDAIWSSEIEYNSIVERSGYVRIDHDLANWSTLSAQFVKAANNIEYYSIHLTEFGITKYYSLNDKLNRLSLEYDSERESKTEEERMTMMWRESFSDGARNAFPDMLPSVSG